MGRELGDLVPKTIEWVRVHGESPFFKGDSIPEFGTVLRGTPSGDRGSFESFSKEAACRASLRVYEELERYFSHAADTRWLFLRRAVKRKSKDLHSISRSARNSTD